MITERPTRLVPTSEKAGCPALSDAKPQHEDNSCTGATLCPQPFVAQLRNA